MFIYYFFRIKAQDMVIRQQGQVIISLKEELREMKEQIKNGNSNVNTKLNKILNHLNVRAIGDSSSNVIIIEEGCDSSNNIEAEYIKIVPDWFGYLKPLLTTKNVSTAICEYLTHESHASYKKFVTTEESKKEKHVMKNLKIITELVRGFIPLGYPKFDRSSGITHSAWKSNLLNITKLGLQALTEFVTTSGLKTTRTAISKSWLINQKNVKPIFLEIGRRKNMVNNVVEKGNGIDESKNVDVCDD